MRIGDQQPTLPRDRAVQAGRALVAVRAAIDEDLGRGGASRRLVAPAALALVDRAVLRPGGAAGPPGLLALRRSAVVRSGGLVHVDLAAVATGLTRVRIADAPLAAALDRLAQGPDGPLFSSPSGARTRRLSARELDGYVRRAAGADVLVDDVIAFAVSVLAHERLGVASAASAAEVLRELATRTGVPAAELRDRFVAPVVLASVPVPEAAAVVGPDALAPSERRTLALLDDARSGLPPENAAADVASGAPSEQFTG